MYYFIINPGSRSGKGVKIWNELEYILQKSHTDYRAYFTEYPGHASLLAGQISKECSPCTIVAVGGDGTANEVINGLCMNSQIRFGYIPTGSGNDLARGLALSTTPETALKAILDPKEIRLVNIGQNQLENHSYRFVISTGIGYDAAVCHEAEHSKIKRMLNHLKLGKLTYLGIALKQLILLRPGAVTITLDEHSPITFDRIFFVAVMNLQYEGGGFMFCPKADVSDDYLDVCLVEKISKLKILCLLPTAFWGRHIKYKGIHILRCKKLSICSDYALPVHTDGEPRNLHTSMNISLLENKLPFIIQ